MQPMIAKSAHIQLQKIDSRGKIELEERKRKKNVDRAGLEAAAAVAMPCQQNE